MNVGVNNRATAINQIFIGVNNIAKLVYQSGGGGSDFQLPTFTGSNSIFGDTTSGRIELYESGTLVLFPGTYDFFAVGGGSGGGSKSSDAGTGGGGGGGGYTQTAKSVSVENRTEVVVTVGAGGSGTGNGGVSSCAYQTGSSIISVNGGERTTISNMTTCGGNGGSGGGGGGINSLGGDGGSDGSAGKNGGAMAAGGGGRGQEVTTRMFGEEASTLYAGGGGGGYWVNTTQSSGKTGAGGEGGGGNGSNVKGVGGVSGTANTGGGGGGGGGNSSTTTSPGRGGSGIVIIRWNNTGGGLNLGDVIASDVVNETILWLPENSSGSVVLQPYIVLSTDYLGGVYVVRKYLSENLKSTWGSSMYYPTSNVDSFITNTFLNSVLSKDVVNSLVMATVPVVPWATTDEKTMQRKAWSLSYGELYDGSEDDDPKMVYFEAGASHRMAYVDGGSNKGIWWTRSVNHKGGIQSGEPYSVDANGSLSNSSGGSASNYVRPAFVLPKNFKIQKRPDGSYTVYDQAGLQTLGGVPVSTESKVTIINVPEDLKPSLNKGEHDLCPYIYGVNGYQGNEGALLIANRVTGDTSVRGSDDWVNSSAHTFLSQYINGNASTNTYSTRSLSKSVQSILIEATIKYEYWTGSQMKTKEITEKGWIPSATDMDDEKFSSWFEGTLVPWLKTPSHRVTTDPNGTAISWFVRSTGWSGSGYYVTTSGAISSGENSSSAYHIRPCFMLPLDTPVRACADGTYDLVLE